MCAQTKPKRDTSKDRSVIVAKQQAIAKKKAAEQAAEKKRREAAAEESARRRQYARKVQTPKAATYLYVDQQASVTKNVSSNGSSVSLNVSTDGKDWNVSYLPTWCSVTKYSNSFYLSIQKNTSHNPRSDWFKVTSDNKEVRVDIKQEGAPINITSRINSANLVHSAVQNISSTWIFGLKINANVTISGAMGQRCLVVAFINDEHGNPIKASYSYPKYGLNTSNDLYTCAEITPTSDYTYTYNTSLFIPYNAMRLLKKKNKLKCQLAVYCEGTGKYVTGANYTLFFRAKKKKTRTITKSNW